MRISASVSYEKTTEEVRYLTGIEISKSAQHRLIHRQEFAPTGERREILDWFHLMENLHKIGGSNQRLFAARSLLWHGKIDETILLFSDCNLKQAENFCAYLEKHRHRIINYYYFQTEQICSIGAGAIESTIKQIDRRTKISGAQWKIENVPQVLAHRCAYLNGLICDR